LRIVGKLLLSLAKLVLVLLVLWAAGIAVATGEWRDSVCHGTPREGWLEGGKQPPLSGANFSAYSTLLWLLGRTAMHAKVRDTIVDAYADLAASAPELRYTYGESGWPWGGSFYPHKTHRNGLSVDFFVPVRNGSGSVSSLPLWPWNRLGYDLRFDDAGNGNGLAIDFEALARHLDALLKSGAKHGVGVRYVILEVPLRQKVLETPTGRTLAGRINFSTKRAWVPHDNHYHIDFDVPCGRSGQ
jgi:penicillin-insensitive murein endopeptidase